MYRGDGILAFILASKETDANQLTSTDAQARPDKSIKLDKMILLFCLFDGGEVFFPYIFFYYYYFWYAEEQCYNLLSLIYCLLRQKKSETLK